MTFFPSETDMTDEQIREAALGLYRNAPGGVAINARQAEALAALVWDGRLAGLRLPDVEPPRTVVIVPSGPQRMGMNFPECVQDRFTREYEVEDPTAERSPVKTLPVPDPPSHGLHVASEDGRLWLLVQAGIMWPVPMPELPDPPCEPDPRVGEG